MQRDCDKYIDFNISIDLSICNSISRVFQIKHIERYGLKTADVAI